MKLSTEPYKGVRDFYPEDMFIQKWIFEKMRKTAESFGYVEYGASMIEPTEIYRAKSGEEIVNEQTYSFKDRGDRDVTIRPEMTPTVARMVASKGKQFGFPLRWYSIPNLFRYEKPQRGRLREHWQLNVDLFGATGLPADAEIISMANGIMKNFGANDGDFEIRINFIGLLSGILSRFISEEEKINKAIKLIDKIAKMEKDAFLGALEEVAGAESAEKIYGLISNKELLTKDLETDVNFAYCNSVKEELAKRNITAKVDPFLTRGFDYYNGIVFEVYDTNPENKRALFGGGRYDDLTDIFGVKDVPAVGFGMGDVTARDFLESHGLLPKYEPNIDYYICVVDEKFRPDINEIADELRKNGVNVIVDLTDKKIGDQIKSADRQKAPFVICIGEEEIDSRIFKVKKLEDGVETKLKENELVDFVKRCVRL